MTTVSEYLAANERYIADKRQVELVRGLTDAELAAMFEANKYLGGSSDETGDLTVTFETLEDFDGSRANHWRERGDRRVVTCGGFSAHVYEDFQLAKNKPRISTMVVVDLGARRIACR